MSWINKLYDTYENCKSEVGVIGTDERTPLLPVSHTLVKANIEIVLNKSGNFIRARSLSKNEAMTIAPCTEDSASRGNGNNPNTLIDKLQYVAGDYTSFFSDKRGKGFFEEYIKLLEGWSNSEYSDYKVKAILNYLKKERLIADLVSQRLLEIDKSSKVTNKWVGDKDNKPMKINDIFIRFLVETPDNINCKTWEDINLFNNYNKYYIATKSKYGLCYVQGKNMLITEKHQSKIRNNGDSAKLISASDTEGFTYLGRFYNSNQAVSIGYETSQKAHNALKWLVEIQGQKFGKIKDGQKVILSWSTQGQKIPILLEDTENSIFGQEEIPVISTEKEFAKRLNEACQGYGCNLDTKAEIIIMGLDSATTGRLSLTYYRELSGRDFLNRIENWHTTCSWVHTYKKISNGLDEKGKPKFKVVTFFGAPAPKDIAIIAFGNEIEDKKTKQKYIEVKDALLKQTIERILPCIIDGANMPYDLVKAAINRASNPISMEKDNWNKTLSIACSLIKKYQYDKFKEEWSMALDENNRDRSYLYGRLLAIADKVEEMTFEKGENRQTNAMRYMSIFAHRPFKTWKIIEERLIHYEAKLGGKCYQYKQLIHEIHSMFQSEDYEDTNHLDGKYLLGFHCQRQVFIEEKNQRIEENKKKKLEELNEGVN